MFINLRREKVCDIIGPAKIVAFGAVNAICIFRCWQSPMFSAILFESQNCLSVMLSPLFFGSFRISFIFPSFQFLWYSPLCHATRWHTQFKYFPFHGASFQIKRNTYWDWELNEEKYSRFIYIFFFMDKKWKKMLWIPFGKIEEQQKGVGTLIYYTYIYIRESGVGWAVG